MDLSIAAWRQNGAQLIDENISVDANLERSKLGTRTLKHVIPAIMGHSDSAGTGPTDDTPFAGILFPDANTAVYSFQFAIPDHWEEGQDITLDVWWNTTVTSGNLRMAVDYAPKEEGETLTATASQLVNTDAAAGSAGFLNKISFTLLAAGIKKGDIMGILLTRDPANGSDTLSADVKVFALTLSLTARG